MIAEEVVEVGHDGLGVGHVSRAVGVDVAGIGGVLPASGVVAWSAVFLIEDLVVVVPGDGVVAVDIEEAESRVFGAVEELGADAIHVIDDGQEVAGGHGAVVAHVPAVGGVLPGAVSVGQVVEEHIHIELVDRAVVSDGAAVVGGVAGYVVEEALRAALRRGGKRGVAGGNDERIAIGTDRDGVGGVVERDMADDVARFGLGDDEGAAGEGQVVVGFVDFVEFVQAIDDRDEVIVFR